VWGEFASVRKHLKENVSFWWERWKALKRLREHKNNLSAGTGDRSRMEEKRNPIPEEEGRKTMSFYQIPTASTVQESTKNQGFSKEGYHNKKARQKAEEITTGKGFLN